MMSRNKNEQKKKQEEEEIEEMDGNETAPINEKSLLLLE